MALMSLRPISNTVRSAPCTFQLTEQNEKPECLEHSKESILEHREVQSSVDLNYNSSSSSATIFQEPIVRSDYDGPKCDLSPGDVGKGAWRYLCGMFMLEFAIWGFSGSYGVLLDFYLHSKLANESGSSFLLPLVGTVSNGSMAMLIPVVATITNFFPHWKSNITLLGLGIFISSLLFSSFSQNSLHVLLTLGLGYGVGGVAIYFPSLSYLPGWFAGRQGLANGIVFAGNGLGGLIFPIVLDLLLRKSGSEVALKYFTFILGAICAMALWVVKPRVKPLPRNSGNFDRSLSALGDLNALKELRFWAFLACNTIQSIASFLPGLYLPHYANSLSLGPSSGTIILAIFNLAGVFSKILLGSLSDHISPHLIGFATSALASASVLGIWGGLGSHGLSSLIIFAIIFGASAGAWTSLYFSMLEQLKVDEKTTMTMYGIISWTRGLGNIISGPVSASLLHLKFSAPPGTGFAAISNSYSSLILFCGLGMGLTAVIEALLYSSIRIKIKYTLNNSA